MQTQPNDPLNPAELRRRAELRLREQRPEAGWERSEADVQRLVHELQVHQIELEMQNEELQRAKEETEAGLEKYSDLYDFAPVGYLTFDREGTIREANLASANLLGIERSRLVKRRLGLYVSPASRPAFNAFLTRVFESKNRECCEVTLLKEGKPPVEVRIGAVAAASGQECRAALEDITELKRAEADRLILNKLESTGVLAGGLAHDFNNLLAVIVLKLELAQMIAPAEKELAQLLEDAKKSALMAGGLTKQLITFAQGGAPVRKPTHLSGVIEESVRSAVSGSRVRCEFSLADDLHVAEVDAGQIGQVIRNIILNAREAMPTGGTISIRAANVPLGTRESPSLPPGDYVRVSIADQGCGIAKELLSKIFDPYFSTKPRGIQRGVGLGLTICHAVVQKHGGAIAVESAAGRGTTFHIYLPASRNLPEARKAPMATPLPRPGRILVMDDEPAVRASVGASLQRIGHEVELAAEGQQAVEIYVNAKDQGRPFDAVILDLTNRGVMGGQETIQALLRIDPDVKAIVMTGYSDDPVVRDPARHGFKGALTKPFSLGRLREIVNRTMDNTPSNTAAS